MEGGALAGYYGDMASKDLTIEILKTIRDEIRTTNSRLETMGADLGRRIDQTNSRLDETNSRLDTMGADLGRRIVESELRTATALTDLAGTVRDLTTLLRTQADLRPRVEKCEKDIDALKARLPDA